MRMEISLPLFSALFCISTFLLGNRVYGQDTVTEAEPAQTEEPQSYTERYLDYYNPQNYGKNYQERYQDKNYVKYYQDMHRENMESFKNSWKYIKQTEEDTARLWQKAKYLNPSAAGVARKIDRESGKTTDSQHSADAYLPYFLKDPFAYRDYQYKKRGYYNPYPHGSNLWIPNPYEATKDGYFTDNPLTQINFSRGTRSTNLPTTNTASVPEPMTVRETAEDSTNPGSNAFQSYPELTPPHLIRPATASDSLEDKLPLRETTQEKPAYSVNAPSSTDSISPPRPAPLSPAQIQYNQGIQFIAQGDYPKARQQFENLVAMKSDSPYSYFALGVSQFFVGEYSLSLLSFQRSQEIVSLTQFSPPTLWQIPIQANDFRLHFKKLAQYVEQHPQNSHARNLFYYLRQLSSTPPKQTR